MLLPPPPPLFLPLPTPFTEPVQSFVHHPPAANSYRFSRKRVCVCVCVCVRAVDEKLITPTAAPSDNVFAGESTLGENNNVRGDVCGGNMFGNNRDVNDYADCPLQIGSARIFTVFENARVPYAITFLRGKSI